MAQKRNSYDIFFKLKAIETAEKTSKEAAAHDFGIDPRRVCEWCSQKDQIVAMKKKRKSNAGDLMEVEEKQWTRIWRRLCLVGSRICVVVISKCLTR